MNQSKQNNKSKKSKQVLKLSALSLGLLNITQVALANTTADKAEATDKTNLVVVLDETVVTAKKNARKANEVTGLGKVVKTAETINKEQVLNIRDLTRYDPGIAVVEQGRGASSGYSIRGMDKNRVAVLVDGINQAQHYALQGPVAGKNYAAGGAINEIEYENVRSIEISKGANSSEHGSGALSGSVAFVTKTADDIIKDGKDWGVQTKTAYASKNNAWVNSVAAAGKAGSFSGLVIYTDRRGQEYKAHDDAYQGSQSFDRAVATTDPNNRTFLMANECANGNYEACASGGQTKLQATPTNVRDKVNVKDYTGPNRLIPNPLTQDSKSLLLRPGYQLNDKHYVGGVYETTKQNYAMQDKTVPAYLTVHDIEKSRLSNHAQANGYYQGNNLGERIRDAIGENSGYGINYAHGVFYDEKHQKDRLGLEYVYDSKGENKWFDDVRVSYDKQDITLRSQLTNTHCSTYPHIDKNCTPDVNKPFSVKEVDNNAYKEQHNLIKAVFNKKLALGSTHHHINLQVGYDKFNSSLSREDYRLATHQSYQKLDYIPRGNSLPDRFKPILGSDNRPICLDAHGYGSTHNHACNTNNSTYQNFAIKQGIEQYNQTNANKIDYQAVIDQYDKQNPNNTLKPFEKIKKSLGQEKYNKIDELGFKAYAELRKEWADWSNNNSRQNANKGTDNIYEPNQATVVKDDKCKYSETNSYADCSTTRHISGNNYFIALKDNMTINKYVDLGLGARYDRIKHKSDVPLVDNSASNQLSWNFGVVVKPTNWLDIAYRSSQGFRMPSFSEMYGERFGVTIGKGTQHGCKGLWYICQQTVHQTKLKPEKSFNQEIGATLYNHLGSLEVSYFKNRYTDLIVGKSEEIRTLTQGADAGKQRGKGDLGFHNGQDADLTGINILGRLDLNAVNSRIPYGLYSTLAYNKVDVKGKTLNPTLAGTNMLFDAIQPSRYVVGIGYDAPSQKWGANAMFTHSDAKNPSEIVADKNLGNGNIQIKQATKAKSTPWRTLDLSGYVNIKDNFTLRAGVYNVFDTYYTTWEALRQTSEGAVNQHTGLSQDKHYGRYAAPGRNYQLALEMKF